MTSKISDKDKKDWENFISSKETLHNKDLKRKKENHYITKSIDLHGYTLEEANKSIQDFINKLIVDTGQGLPSNNDNDPYVSKEFSILKYSVPEFIKKNIELIRKISEITNAKIEDGGEGAFYIYLKKKK